MINLTRVATRRLYSSSQSPRALYRASSCLLSFKTYGIKHIDVRRSFSSTISDAAQNEQILMSLGEYTTGQQHEKSGDYNKACQEYTRVHDIISAAMGKSSPIAHQGIPYSLLTHSLTHSLTYLLTCLFI